MTTTNTTRPVSPSCRQCRSPITEQTTAGLCSTCVGLRVRDAYRSAPRSAPPFPETPTLPPGFTFVEHLGRGGMGHVYLAHQENLDRYVALKQLAEPWQSEPRAQKRFLHEARAVARLSHPHIVPVLEIGETDVPLWFTMEFVEGGDLTQLLERRGGRLPWRDALALMIPVAEAIEYAHRAGIAHRDLKPSNILLDATGQPKVADFGLAWVAGQTRQELTHAGEVVGTPSYLPPEAVGGRGRDDDARPGDIYALGAVLYHLIAGQPPFTGDNPMAILAAISQKPSPRLSDHDGLGPIPASLDRICATCLEKDPSKRFVCAAEFATALGLLQTGGVWGRARTLRPLLWATAATLAVTLTVGVVSQWTHRPAKATTALPATAPSPILALLPEQETSNDPAITLLAEGLNDEIVATLNRTTDIKVLAPRSSRQAQTTQTDLTAAARSLGANAVLTTKVRRRDDKIWVSAHLADATTGATILLRTYTRSDYSLLNLQTDLATDLAVALGHTLRPDRALLGQGTVSTRPEAQAKLVEARRLFNDASASVDYLNRAEALLKDALTIDENFAAGLAQLSLVHTQMFNWGNDRSERRLAMGLDAAQRALQLNPDLPEASVALGQYYLRGTRDYALAHQHLSHALELAPNNPDAIAALAHTLRRQGDFEAAAEKFQAAVELDPFNANLAYNSVDTLFLLRRYEEADSQLLLHLKRLGPLAALTKLRGDLYVNWKGDTQPMAWDLDLRKAGLPTKEIYTLNSIEYLILTHRLNEALDLWHRDGIEEFNGQTVYWTKPGMEALLLTFAGRKEEAIPNANAGRSITENRLRRTPNDPRLLMHLAYMHAILGNRRLTTTLIHQITPKNNQLGVDAFDRGHYLNLSVIAAAIIGDEQLLTTLSTEALTPPNRLTVGYILNHPILAKSAPILSNQQEKNRK